MATVFIVGESLHGGALARVLRGAGYHTLPLTDAAMAIDVLRSIKADVLVVSLAGDATDGASLIQILRHDSRWQSMPVIVTGAKRAGDYHGIGERLGVGAVLVESESTPREVLNQIRRFTEHLESSFSADDSFKLGL